MSHKQSDRQRRATAFHEAGHAVQAFVEAVPIAEVSIVPSGDTSGRVTLARKLRAKRGEISERAAGRYGRVLLAGLIAQRKDSPRSVRHFHAHGDHGAAVELASRISGSPREAEAWIGLWTIQVEEKLDVFWPGVERLAAELMKASSVPGEAVRPLLFPPTLRQAGGS